MFLHDFVQVDLPFQVVQRHVLDDNGRWLSALATEACAAGDDLKVRIGFDGHSPLGKEVTVTLGDATSREDLVTVPLQWRASSAKGLFPTMDGELEIAALGDNCTHLGLMGRYEPPLGPVGRVLDAIVLHHLAERSVRAFLLRVAEVLEQRERNGDATLRSYGQA